MLRVEHPVWRLSILAGLLTGAIWAQESLPKPAANARIVRVRIGNSCGWRTEGYNEIETTVEPGRIVIAKLSDSDKKKYPDLTQEYQITRRGLAGPPASDRHKSFSRVLQTIDRLSGMRRRIAWAQLEFNDGTKKSVAYVNGADPSPLVELRQKIAAIEMKATLRPQ